MDKIKINDFFSMMNNAGEGVFICNRDKKISYANEMLCKLLACEKNAIIGKPVNTIIDLYINTSSIDLCNYIEGKTYAKLPKGTMIKSFEGKLFHVSMSITAVYEGDQLNYSIIILRDIEALAIELDHADRYASLVEQSHISMIITNFNWEIIYCNPYFRKKYIKDDQCHNGVDALKLLFKNEPPDFREMINFYIEQFGSWSSEESFSLADASLVWEEIQIQAVKDMYGNIIRYTIMMKDITNRKNQEMYIEHEKQTFEAIFENTTVGLLIINENGTIIKTNTEALRIFKVNISEILNVSFHKFFICTHNSDLLNFKCNHCDNCIISKTLERVIEKDMTIRGQELIYADQTVNNHTERNVKYLRMNASPAMIKQKKHVLVALQDISDIKRISRELIHSERHLRMITDSMLDTIVQVNHNNLVVYASPSAKILTGYEINEIVGRDFRDFILLDEYYSNEIRDGIRDDFEPNIINEFKIRTKNGVERWIQSMGNILEQDHKRTFVFVLRDITEQVMYRNELKASKMEADEANAAKSIFLANMSHEIRTPMNGIIGMTELTLMTQLNDQQRKYLEMVKTSATSLLTIINSVLDFSKIEAGKMVPDEHIFNFTTFLNETMMPLKVQAVSKKIDLDVVRTVPVPEFFIGDAPKIRQILNNIVFNAIKFTDHGKVTVRLSGEAEEKLIFKMTIDVIDTGIGISEENKSRIFESFNQADPSATRKYGGTGLGLTISKGLAEILGGSLSVESTLGIGTTVSIKLPLVIGNAFGPIGNKKHLEIPEVTKQLRILVAEDERVNQTVINKLLTMQGHYVDLAENGKEAVMLFIKNKYDLVIMDIQMPEKNGIEAMHEMRLISDERNETTPIIAFTAYALKSEEEKLRKEGFDDYISKPVEVEKFYNVVMKAAGLFVQNEFNFEDIISKIKQEESVEAHDNALITQKIKSIEEGIDDMDFSEIEALAGELKYLVKNHTTLRRTVLKMELAIRKESLESFKVYFNNFKENFRR